MDKLQGPQLEQAKSYIYAIDFSNIINKMVNYDGWLEQSALVLCRFYRNFLYLNRKYRNDYHALPPSEEIDVFWHYHILDTQKYEQDCIAIFGKYFHHYPYFGIDNKTSLADLYKAFEETQRLHYIEFGEYIPFISKTSFIKNAFKRTKQLLEKFNVCY